MRQLRLIWWSSYSASLRRVSSLPDVADGVGLPGVMVSSECDQDREGTINDDQSEEMGSVVSDLSGTPDQEGSAVPPVATAECVSRICFTYQNPPLMLSMVALAWFLRS